MNKKKQTFSPLRVIKVLALFFIVGILIVLLIMGIENKNTFSVQHEKEIKKWEEKVEKSCSPQCVSEIKELPKLLFGKREWKEKELEKAKKEKDSGNYFSEKFINRTIERLEEELNAKTKLYCKDGNCNSFADPCEIIMRDCVANKAALSNIKDENPPSIFYYYGIIIGGIGGIIDFVLGSVVFMFFILLVLILITLFEVHKLKNKNNTH